MRSEVFEGINSVDQAVWSRLTRGCPYAGWHWCQYGEAALGCKGQYLVTFDGDDPIGGAMFWVMRKEVIPSRNPFVRGLVMLYLNQRPLIACRTPVLTDHKGFFLPSDPERRSNVLDEIKRVGIEIARQNRGSFFLADYLFAEEVDYDWGRFLKLKDFFDVGTCMTVEWETFDEYMNALKARNKKAYKNVQHNTRYAKERGITICFQHATPPIEALMDLIRTNMKHYQFPYDAARIRRIIDASFLLPEQDSVWGIAYVDGKMVGCELLLHDQLNHVCKPVLYGRDYATDYVYFYMCYEDIRYSTETLRAKTIIYDTKAYDFKRRIGFGADSRNSLVFYPNSRLESALARGLARFMDN